MAVQRCLGSKGSVVTPRDLLDIYEPSLVMFMYLRKLPKQTFSLAFDTEVYRQYDEIDKYMQMYKEDKLENENKRIFETIKEKYPEHIYDSPIPFRQLVGFSQIVSWEEKKLNKLLKESSLEYSKESIKERLPKAKQWLEKYNSKDKIILREQVNKEYSDTINSDNKEYLSKLVEYLKTKGNSSVSDLETFIYSLPKEKVKDEKELKKVQRDFFKVIYNLLISRDVGPRLATFLWALDKEKIINLLNID